MHADDVRPRVYSVCDPQIFGLLDTANRVLNRSFLADQALLRQLDGVAFSPTATHADAPVPAAHVAWVMRVDAGDTDRSAPLDLSE